MAAGAGELKVHSSVSETGESEDSIAAAYDGPAVEIGFNAEYLLDFLRAVATEEVTFLFKDAHSAGELRPGGEKADNYRYVIMPTKSMCYMTSAYLGFSGCHSRFGTTSEHLREKIGSPIALSDG